MHVERLFQKTALRALMYVVCVEMRHHIQNCLTVQIYILVPHLFNVQKPISLMKKRTMCRTKNIDSGFNTQFTGSSRQSGSPFPQIWVICDKKLKQIQSGLEAEIRARNIDHQTIEQRMSRNRLKQFCCPKIKRSFEIPQFFSFCVCDVRLKVPFRTEMASSENRLFFTTCG